MVFACLEYAAPDGVFSFAGFGSTKMPRLRRQFFAVGQVIAVPTNERCVAGVFKQKFQRGRFDVAVAKDHVGFADGIQFHLPTVNQRAETGRGNFRMYSLHGHSKKRYDISETPRIKTITTTSYPNSDKWVCKNRV